MKQTDKYLLTLFSVVLIAAVIVVAMAIVFIINRPEPQSQNTAAANSITSPNPTVTPNPTPPRTRNPHTPINRVQVQVECNSSWIGVYGIPGSKKQLWNGTSERTATMKRPDGANPWIVIANVQAFSTRNSENITFSLVDTDGFVIATKTASTYCGAILTIVIDIDNPQKEVIYNVLDDTIEVK